MPFRFLPLALSLHQGWSRHSYIQGYVPKVPTMILRPIGQQAFCPPPFTSSDQEKLNFLCIMFIGLLCGEVLTSYLIVLEHQRQFFLLLNRWLASGQSRLFHLLMSPLTSHGLWQSELTL